VAGSCECCDEPSGSGTSELVSYLAIMFIHTITTFIARMHTGRVNRKFDLCSNLSFEKRCSD
jgi:hypothetical protein